MHSPRVSPQPTSAPSKALLAREEGASLAEYSLLVGLIAVACIGAATLFGVNVVALFQRMGAPL